MPPIPDTPIGLAAFALFLVAQVALRALQLRAHSRHEERKAQHAAAMAAAPDEGRRAIVAAHQPDPPPGFGPLLVLLALGALLGLVVAAARGEQRLVGRWLSADVMAVSAPESATYCTKASDCASGCCDRGSCSCAKLELASAAPLIAGCTSAADCRTGCACTGGQCTPCSAAEKKPKPQPPQKQKPRLVASLHREACAGCEVLPQMVLPIAQPFQD